MSEVNNSYEQEYESRFAWRRARQLHNLEELGTFPESGGADPIKAFPRLLQAAPESLDSPQHALRWSILLLSHEATECFIYGEFQSCILTCGAVVERVLKLEYEAVHGTLPKKSEWTLGRCIKRLNWTGTRVTPEITELAKQMVDPRNDRAHALLEHRDPLLSTLGGENRGVEVLRSGHALIEPYRGDAKRVIEITYKILAKLYS